MKLFYTILLFAVVQTAFCNDNEDLQIAAGNGDFDEVTRLLQTGADVNYVRESDRYTALLLATLESYEDIVLLLIKWGALVNIRADAGAGNWTPLHMAANYEKRYNIASLLIKNGADVNAVDDFNATPLHYAALSSSKNVELLLTNKANVHSFSYEQITPLHYAASAASEDSYTSLVLLIEAGAGVDVSSLKNNLNTPLHLSTKNNSVKKVKALLRYGADKTLKNKDGKTALDIAIELGYSDIISVLEN